MPTTNPVLILYKDAAHQFTLASGTVDPKLPSGQFDARGGKYNLAYTWLDQYSDVAVENATRGSHGGRPQMRIRVPPYPRRGIGAVNTDYAVDGWRVIDFATELGWAKDAGVTGVLCEATGQLLTDQQVKIYLRLFDGAARVGGIQCALQFDSVAMGNNGYPAENYADITYATMVRPEYFSYAGAKLIGAFELGQITNGSSSNVSDPVGANAWVDAFCAQLASHGVSDVQFMPLQSGWDNGEFDAFRVQMERVTGVPSWGGRVDINNPTTVARQVEHAAYIRANGGHRVAWAVRPQAIYAHNGFYYEGGGFKLLKTQYETALANMQPGDAIYKFTWNDMLEGAECCPGDRTQWAILDVCAYYNTWWRTGSAPEIVRDCVYYMHRLHAFDAAPNVSYQTISTGQPGNRFYNSTQAAYPSRNIVSTLVFLRAPADVQVITTDGTRTFSNVPAGVTLLDDLTADSQSTPGVPLPVAFGGRPRFVVTRGGETVVDLTSAFSVHAGATVPYWQDMQYGCGGSLRDRMRQLGYSHPYIEPVELVRDYLKGQARYG